VSFLSGYQTPPAQPPPLSAPAPLSFIFETFLISFIHRKKEHFFAAYSISIPIFMHVITSSCTPLRIVINVREVYYNVLI
jgi:hypothetical protein